MTKQKGPLKIKLHSALGRISPLNISNVRFASLSLLCADLTLFALLTALVRHVSEMPINIQTSRFIVSTSVSAPCFAAKRGSGSQRRGSSVIRSRKRADDRLVVPLTGLHKHHGSHHRSSSQGALQPPPLKDSSLCCPKAAPQAFFPPIFPSQGTL